MPRCPLDQKALTVIAPVFFLIGCGPVSQLPSETDMATRRVRFALDQPVWVLAASPDGRFLATADSPGAKEPKVRLRDLATGRELSRKAAAEGHARFATFAPKGRRLAVVYDPRWLDQAPFRIQLWDVAADGTLQSARTLEPDAPSSSRSVFAAAFSPTGESLVAGTAGEVLYLWDAATGQLKRRFQGGVAATFASDGRTLIAVTHDGAVRRFDTTTWNLLGPAEPIKRTEFLFVTSVAFAPDGKRVAIGDDWSMVIEDVATNRTVSRLQATVRGASGSFSPDGRTLAVVGEGAAHFFDPATGAERAWLKGVCGPGQFLGDGRYLAFSDARSITLHGPEDFVPGKAPEPPDTDSPDVSLRGELIARQDTYTLDREGDTPQDFSARIQFGDPYPERPRVDLLLKLWNTGKETLTLKKPEESWTLFLVGPGALNHDFEQKQTGIIAGPDGPDSERPGPVHLAPGESVTVPVSDLNPDGFAFWVLPGGYRIAGTCSVDVSPAPKGSVAGSDGFGSVSLRLAPVRVKVLPGNKARTAREIAEDHAVLRPPPPGTVVSPKPDDGSDQTNDRLWRLINYRDAIPAGTPLEDALGWLAERCDLDIRIDRAAFRNAGDAAVARKKIELRSVPLIGVTVKTVLELLLDQADTRMEVHGRRIWVLPETAPRSLAERLPPATRRLKAMLDERISLADGIKDGTPLSEALDRLGDRFGVNFLFDTRSFAKAHVRDLDRRPVKLAPRNKVRLGTVLDELLKPLGATYVPRDTLVVIVPRREG
jgi:hypothetical protein